MQLSAAGQAFRVVKAVLIGAVPPMMLKSAKSVLKTYPGVPHGMCTTHPEIINADILAFIRG